MAKKTSSHRPDDPLSRQKPTHRQTLIVQISNLFKDEFSALDANTQFDKLFQDVLFLYEGKWQSHEACQVEYHNIDHSLEVALATARMATGWNRIKQGDDKLSDRMFLCGMAASLFHDSGYLKDKNDSEGTGGKYTFSHVQRSRDLARNYLSANRWDENEIIFICNTIDITEFNREPDLSVFRSKAESVMARMVATADLVAQMADINYISRLRDLHDEFLEAYDSEGRKNLEDRSVHIFGTFHEILDSTPEFYENFVLPRLSLFDRMDQYLVVFFADGRNPYLENIIANISGQLLKQRVQWQRLGDILQQLGLVPQDTITEALTRQRRNISSAKNRTRQSSTNLSLQMLEWLKSPSTDNTRLGDILMEMRAVEPKSLRAGLLSQLLPEQLTQRLTGNELLNLLQISLLAQNLYDDPWVFGQIIEVTLELLRCDSGSLLLIDILKTEMLIAIHTGQHKKRLEGKSLPLDKGLSGWVFRHARAAYVSGSSVDELFHDKAYHDEMKINNILAAPLHVSGEIIGVVEVMNKRKSNFNDHDADILTLVANIMASSLSLINKLLLKKTP